ncbi:MAG: hypothetical protein AAFZ15_14870 [Bacteroidota bacterium]
MKKYLRYLLQDIDALIAEAPTPTEMVGFFGDEEEEVSTYPTRYVKIADLIGIKSEVFPPEHLLTDNQVITLIEAISDLWSAWLLHWNMPSRLPARKQYTIMVEEMEKAPVSYHPEDGGDVHICHLTMGKGCPFGEDDSECQCLNMRESMQHEFDLWEEYLRSQGLDPDIEITPEEEALFEEDMRHRREQKELFADDFIFHNTDPDYQLMLEAELTEEEQKEFLYALEMADELLGIILDNLSDYDSDAVSDEEEDEIDFPF